MRTALIRRLMYLAALVLLLWAALLAPMLLVPERTANLYKRFLPSRVAERLTKLIPMPGGASVDWERVKRDLTPPEEAKGTDITLERYLLIQQVITGEVPVSSRGPDNHSPTGPLDSMIKVLLTLAHRNVAKKGGFAVLELSNVAFPRQLGVREGDVMEDIEAIVKSVRKDAVLFHYQGEDVPVFRDGLSPEDLSKAREELRRALREESRPPSSEEVPAVPQETLPAPLPPETPTAAEPTAAAPPAQPSAAPAQPSPQAAANPVEAVPGTGEGDNRALVPSQAE